MDNNSSGKSLRIKLQKFGSTLASMVMPNIGIFIGWGILTALFFPDGWFPNEYLAELIDPTMKYLIPILIGFTAGYNLYSFRGGVIGALATMGVVIGADINMLIAGMIMGPLAAWLMKKTDNFLKPKTKSGLEMLVDNFSLGILGLLLMIFGYMAVEPIMSVILTVLSAGATWATEKSLIPLAGLIVPPAQVLFLNNAINHGIMIPLGILEASEVGKSILFFVEALPGGWVGLLLAYIFFGVGVAKKTAPAALLIFFFGGIGEPGFPFALINPLTIIGPMLGSTTQLLIAGLLNGGLIGPLAPASIFTFLSMTPQGSYLANSLAYIGGILVSFVVVAFILKKTTKQNKEDEILEVSNELETKDMSKGNYNENPSGNNGVNDISTVTKAPIRKVIFACDAGMGSSAMGTSMLKKRIENAKLDVDIKNVSINNIPEDYDLIITNKQLEDRVRSLTNQYGNNVITIESFLDEEEYKKIIAHIKESHGIK
ncbi:hypothetical protein GCM10025886_18910 [Tetragenococcus halophilus subsp. flandriensis]|uniref:PTS mannitol transporter subunit IICB n=1 Tax=Tetragenococcus halophilus TaxID=51669 RepID=UPI0023E966E1|nr:PTS mannitol transporter subunit IICB [Tetragenococcus halophilus]GMA08740.1 hypothetical protein GCM10025886_18910 [Tetragenococcus halophilus subsp. flandriensis]